MANDERAMEKILLHACFQRTLKISKSKVLTSPMNLKFVVSSKAKFFPDYAGFCGGFLFGTADVATSRFSNQSSA